MYYKKSSTIRIISIILAILLFLPILSLIIEAISKPSPSFKHLADTVLFDYIKNSIILVIGVCFMSVVWGLPSAWLTIRYKFPGYIFFRWSLLLPMAMPSYVVAYIYTDLFDYSGFIQHFIRYIFSYSSPNDYWFFDMRTMGGTIFVLSLVLSPYVFWITSLNLNTQCQSIVHASRLLNNSELYTFFRVILPLSRPALAIACSLVAMETLADFGTVSYFSIWNITTAIYETWLSLFDLSAAAKLSCLLLLFVIIIVIIEKFSRKRIRYHNEKYSPLIRYELKGVYKLLATAWCSFVFFLGFLLPMLMILYYATIYISDTNWPIFFKMLKYSFMLALGVSFLAVIISFIMQINCRINKSKLDNISKQISSLGYAVPGTVLAIGVLIVTTNTDSIITKTSEFLGFGTQKLIFTGTLLAMAYAFITRFSAISIGSIESGMNKIPSSLDKTAFLFNLSPIRTIKKIFLPLLRNSIITSFILVFLESIKELSAAILLRPFNVETLATYVYQYMTAEEFEVAALPTLVIVLAGIPAVIILTMSMSQRDNK